MTQKNKNKLRMDRKGSRKKRLSFFGKENGMYLVIGEKPSVSQTLAKVLGAGKRQDGYLSGADCIVSWCLGHLAEYVSPEVYDSRYEKWEFSQLPIYRNIGSLRWQGIRKTI